MSIDPKEFDFNHYTRNSSKVGCVLGFYLEYLKELHELHNEYPLVPDKTEINGEMLSNYQPLLLVFTIFLLVMLKKQWLTFLIKKSMCFIKKTCSFAWN